MLLLDEVEAGSINTHKQIIEWREIYAVPIDWGLSEICNMHRGKK